jgi:hypothetical protein
MKYFENDLISGLRISPPFCQAPKVFQWKRGKFRFCGTGVVVRFSWKNISQSYFVRIYHSGFVQGIFFLHTTEKAQNHNNILVFLYFSLFIFLFKRFSAFWGELKTLCKNKVIESCEVISRWGEKNLK